MRAEDSTVSGSSDANDPAASFGARGSSELAAGSSGRRRREAINEVARASERAQAAARRGPGAMKVKDDDIAYDATKDFADLSDTLQQIVTMPI